VDRFGAALAGGDASSGAADFDGDGRGDLAIGAPGEDSGELINETGVVHVIYGSAANLDPVGDQAISQDSPGIRGGGGPTDRFGAALAVGDFAADGDSDIAIGVPGESLGSAGGAGAVNVIYGSPGGLSSAGDDVLTQNRPGVEGAAGPGDAFGQSLASARFNAGTAADLAVGAPGEDLGPDVDAGVVHAFFGSTTGLTTAGDRLFSQDTPGIEGAAGDGDRFG
jgi:FG-GAP repeat